MVLLKHHTWYESAPCKQYYLSVYLDYVYILEILSKILHFDKFKFMCKIVALMQQIAADFVNLFCLGNQ